MAGPTALSTYLQARRALVTPADVGLPGTGPRRTPGLRREEVATLAGISVDYYVRLEKGRDTNPSAQVLTALARVLQLDAAATAHLHGLVRPGEPDTPGPAGEEVPEGSRLLLDAVGLPAFVESRAFDVLAANAAAGALSPAIRPGANRLRSMFLDDAERALHPDWDRDAATMVAEFRASLGPDLTTPAVAALVEELSAASATFREVWRRHDVDLLTGAVVRWEHPRAGALALRRVNYPVPGTRGQVLVVYFAAPGGDDADRLADLTPG
ncbi:helix-turn-helix domain-containing protein [Pseudonocardia alni]|uniref:helix-turn-helix domain-containing protein n=1 Tax=Pseudonocardia alni TaxID=33907 RepID=UPI00279B8D99|nr:helix-turn-helix transcriptional regulator [Pseudonocardia alni]